MDFMSYIIEEALIFIPVLYIIGTFLKTSKVDDKYIPLLILIMGIIVSMLSIGFTVDGFVQGVLVAGAAVFTNQLVKQSTK